MQTWLRYVNVQLIQRITYGQALDAVPQDGRRWPSLSSETSVRPQ